MLAETVKKYIESRKKRNSMIRTYKYRLRPNRIQTTALDSLFSQARRLYNAALFNTGAMLALRRVLIPGDDLASEVQGSSST